MARGINKVILVGNLTRDPELRFTQGGIALCEFGLAWNLRKQNGEDEAMFFNVTCWRTLAENVAESLGKGARVIVTGRLNWRSWESEAGEKRNAIDSAMLDALEGADGLFHGLPRGAYTSEAFLALEAERVFAPNWAFVEFAHSLPGPGDMVPLTLAGLPILLVRDKAGGVQAFDDFHAGVIAARDRVMAGPGGRSVAVFTSGGPIGVNVGASVNAPPGETVRINWRVRNVSITEFTFSRSRISFDSFNGLPHLLDAPELGTYR